MLTDNAATEQALRCLTSADQHVGVGAGMSRQGAAAAMARTRVATTAPNTNRCRRTDEARWGIGGMGGIYIAEAWGVSILQPLIGSLVECCSVVTCVLASGLYIIASQYEIS